MMSRFRIAFLIGLGCLANQFACAPGVDLLEEKRNAPRPDAGPDAMPLARDGFGAGRLINPSVADDEVPLNLAQIVFALPSPLEQPGQFLLRSESRDPLPLPIPEPVHCGADQSCYRLSIPNVLPLGLRLQLELTGSARLASGDPVPPGSFGWFRTGGPQLGGTNPAVGPVRIDSAGSCVRLRFAADRPGTASVALLGEGDSAMRPTFIRFLSAPNSARFDIPLRIPAVLGSPVLLKIAVDDRLGRLSDEQRVELPFSPQPLLWAITEVVSNALGEEGVQELVELVNLGGAPQSLEGLTIEDANAGDPLGDTVVPVGGHVVVVPQAFDFGRAPPLATGTLVVRVSGRIGKDGLSPREPVRLRGPQGQVLSSYGGWVDTTSTVWEGKSVQRIPRGACDHPASFTTTPREPNLGFSAEK